MRKRARARTERQRRRRHSSWRHLECLEERRLLAVFTASQDNTLYEESTNPTSNGEGPHIYAGMTRRPSNPLRRALVAFDLSSIPAGSVVTDARLDLLVTKNPFGSLEMHDFSLHRVLSDWGEGGSNTEGEGGLGSPAEAGDATWLHRFFDATLWSTPGGDFELSSSATDTVGNDGDVASWSSPDLIADVQAWVDAPADNFGWIILGEEGTAGTARRFSSREGTTPPQLDVTFTAPAVMPDVTLAVDEASISEAQGEATVTSTLSEATTVPVTVALEFSGSANAESDYEVSGTEIVILPGATSGSITVAAVDDTDDESDETVVIDIGAVTNGNESEVQQQTITITDNDDPVIPTVSLSIDRASIAEEGGVATATATLSLATTVAVTVELEFSGTAVPETDYAVSVTQIVVAPGSTTGTVTVTAVQDTLDEPDETVVIDIATVTNGTEDGLQQVVTAITDDDEPTGFTVTDLVPTSTGFRARFSNPLDAGDLNLYDTQSAGLGLADLMLVGEASGPVVGSLVVESSLLSIEFIRTGAPLAADVYTVTLRSASNGFEDEGGRLLDGDGDGSSGDDFNAQFEIEQPVEETVTVSVPDFVRGPGQNVNLPADVTTGIPLTVSEGDNVRAIDLRIAYDPAKLVITDAVVGSDAPGGATVVFNGTTPGLAVLVYFSADSLPVGPATFVNLVATVPDINASENYGSQQVLDIHGAVVSDGNDNEVPVIEDDGIQLVSFFGDPTGNGRVNAADASGVARFAALLDSGFSGAPATDPQIVGDISGNGRVNAGDASLVARFAALLPVDDIPPIPGGVLIAGVLDGDRKSTTIVPTTVFAPNAQVGASPSRAGVGDELVGIAQTHSTLDFQSAVDSVIAHDRDRLANEAAGDDLDKSLETALDELSAVFE